VGSEEMEPTEVLLKGVIMPDLMMGLGVLVGVVWVAWVVFEVWRFVVRAIRERW